MAYVTICTVEELPAAGELREVSAGGRALCLANDGGRLVALDNVCPHRGGPLAEGTLEAGKVLCPWHAWGFSLTTGCADEGGCVGVYSVRAEDGLVQVEIRGA